MDLNVSLDQTVRQQVGQQLALILADTYVLYVKTQNFHWNLIDPRFFSLHELFEKQYEELAEAVDEIAERIRMLGEQAPGTLRQFLDMASLDESSSQDLNGDEMLQELMRDHESVIRHIREQIDYSSQLGDEGTADLLIQRLRAHEKAAWMLRSHLNEIV